MSNRIHWLMTGTVLALGLSMPAFAQETSPADDDARPGDIIVTAEKRSARLLDVPVPITALAGEQLADDGLLRLEDYYKRIPGVTFALIGNTGEPLVVIRGLSSASTANPTVGFVIDDVSYGRSTSLGASTWGPPDLDPSDLERVEVLRGPQGTLYGASSIGGLIKYVTADPVLGEVRGRVQIGTHKVKHGEDLGLNLRGSLSVPVGDTIAIRVSGFRVRDAGWVDNSENGAQDVNTRDTDGGRITALWRPSDDFSLKMGIMIQDSQRNGAADVDKRFLPRWERTDLAGSGVTRRKTVVYSATATAQLGAVELVSATGYSTDKSGGVYDYAVLAPFIGLFIPGAERLTLDSDNSDNRFSQELRATIPIGDKVRLLVGGYYDKENYFYNIRGTGRAADTTPVGLLYANKSTNGTDYEEFAAFGNAEISFSDRFDLQLGARYATNKQVSNKASIACCTFAPVDPPASAFALSSASSKDNAFTFLVTPRFKISPDQMLYVRVASGYRPGGPNFNCDNIPAEFCQFGADRTVNYEIGYKGRILDNLTLDASVYYIDWKNVQIGPLNYIDNGIFYTTYTDNAASARAKGAEVSIDARPWKGMSITGFVAYSDAYLTAPTPAPLSGPTDPQIPAGASLPNNTKWSGSLSADQDFALDATGSLMASVGFTASYVGKRPGAFPPPGQPQTALPKPAYTQYDLRAALHYDGFSLTAYVNNLTDKRGVLRDGDDALDPNLATYIQPRTIGLSLSKTF